MISKRQWFNSQREKAEATAEEMATAIGVFQQELRKEFGTLRHMGKSNGASGKRGKSTTSYLRG